MTTLYIHTCPFFFYNCTADTEIYTLSLHDALPISEGETEEDEAEDAGACQEDVRRQRAARGDARAGVEAAGGSGVSTRSEEHTSELQSHSDLVCRLLLEKKKNTE